MKTRLLCIIMVASLVLCGTVLASNMGFKIVNPMVTGGTSTNYVSLPYNWTMDLNASTTYTAADLKIDMGTTNVFSISQWQTATETWKTYTTRAAQDFVLNPGEGYKVVTNAAFDHVIVGSHDPAVDVTLATGGSSTNYIAVPYHSMVTKASELKVEMGGVANVFSISQWQTATETWKTYTTRAAQDFTLNPGEAVKVVTNAGFVWSPSHY